MLSCLRSGCEPQKSGPRIHLERVTDMYSDWRNLKLRSAPFENQTLLILKSIVLSFNDVKKMSDQSETNFFDCKNDISSKSGKEPGMAGVSRPTNFMSMRRRDFRLCKCQNELGSSTAFKSVRSYERIHKSSREDSCPMHGGITLSRALSSRFRLFSVVKLQIESGIISTVAGTLE